MKRLLLGILAAALVLAAGAAGECAGPLILRSDPSWKCATKVPSDWNMPGFDDSGWPAAESPNRKARGKMLAPWPPDTAARATGVFFDAQSREALAEAVARFEAAEPFFDAKMIRAHAERFSAARFRDEFLREVQTVLRLDAAGGGG